MTDDEGAPAGWYPDPLERGLERYWTGNEWFGEPRTAITPHLPGELG